MSKNINLLNYISSEVRTVFLGACVAFGFSGAIIAYGEYFEVRAELTKMVSEQVKRVIEGSQNSGSVLFLQRDLEEIALPFKDAYPSEVRIVEPQSGQVVGQITNKSKGIFNVPFSGTVKSDFALLSELDYQGTLTIDKIIIGNIVRLLIFLLILVATLILGALIVTRRTKVKLSPFLDFMDWINGLKVDPSSGQIISTVQIENEFLNQTSLTTIIARFNRFAEEVSRDKVDIALGRIASQVAHDIRSPLSALCLAIRESNLETEREEIINSSLSRIQKIADDLLKKRREVKIGTEKALAGTVIKSIIEEKQIQFPSASIVFYPNNFEKVLVHFPEVSLGRIVSNIINNSIEAMPSLETKISVGLSKSHKYLNISIIDTGPGIDVDVLEKIRNGHSVSTKPKGSGIGLSSAKEMITSAGGKLEIQSSKGHGTIINISLIAATTS